MQSQHALGRKQVEHLVQVAGPLFADLLVKLPWGLFMVLCKS